MNSQTPIYLRSSTIYFTLALIALSLAVWHGVIQFQDFRDKGLAVSEHRSKQAQVETELADEETEFKLFAAERAKKQSELAASIESILPPDENYTDITRHLDQYFSEHDTTGNPITQSSLRFGKGQPVPGLDGISALSVSMNLEATRDNFLKFLNFVSSSGSLDNGIRLMDIESIQLNFSDGGELVKNPKQEVNFTVEMNAYYQTPKIPR